MLPQEEKNTAVVPLRRNRSYLMWFSQDLLAQLVFAMSSFFIPLVTFSLSSDPLLSGTLLTVATVIATIAALPGGVLVDRVNRRTSLLIQNGGIGLLWAVAAILAVSGQLTLPIFAAIVWLTALFEGVFSAAPNALLRAVVAPAQLPAAIANNQGRDAVVDLGAAPVAGLILALGNAVLLGVTAVVSLLSSIFTLLIDRSAGEVTRSDSTPWFKDLIFGFVWLGRHPTLIVSSAIVAAANFALTGIIVTLQLGLSSDGVSPLEIGLLLAAASIGMLVGAALASVSARRLPLGAIMIGALIVILGTVLIMAALPVGIGSYLAPMAVIGLILPFVNSGLVGWVYSQIPHELQGRVNSAGGLLIGGFGALAPVAVGFAVAHFSIPHALLVCAASVVLALVLAVATTKIRRIGTPESWVVA